LIDLTRGVLALEPDLIVWPETAMPVPSQNWADDIRQVPAWRRVAELLPVDDDAALLIGTMAIEGPPRPRLYNAALLVDGPNGVRGAYAKQHLVPFGEYVPFESRFPALGALSPMGWSCSPGLRPVVFELTAGRTFAAMICFEDVFPDLVRRLVRAGARALVNLTNDAWFDGSAAAEQHLSHSVLRAVENRVQVVRAANTGVSGFIDRTGRIQARIAPDERGGPVSATLLSGVELPPPGSPPTRYTRLGDWALAAPCALATGAVLLLALIPPRRKGKNAPSNVPTPGGKNPDALAAPVARPPDARMETQDD